MRIFLDTLGCRLNDAEVDSWRQEFSHHGHEVVGDPVGADVMVLNTCAVTSEAARKSRRRVSGLHRQNPEGRLVVTGCYSELQREHVTEHVGVDLVVGNVDKDVLVSVVNRELALPTMPVIATEPSTHHAFGETRTRAFIKVQDGCRNRCTFCIVTIARGEERSLPIDELVREINLRVNRGYQEVVLTGVHLGGYGSDCGSSLKELVHEILQRTQVRRLRLSSLEPWDLPEDFWTLWQEPRLMPHLHLPLQSGSDSVLKRMARRCPSSDYRQLVANARRAIPDLVLTTDIIVGFPGETDEEFRDSLAFVEEIGFAHVHVFTYSPRQGTTAARLPGHVSSQTKRQRSKLMHELTETMKLQQLAGGHGKVRPVLWERSPQQGTDGGRRYFGYTDNYLPVQLDVPAGAPSLENRIVHTQLHCDGAASHLLGVYDAAVHGGHQGSR